MTKLWSIYKIAGKLVFLGYVEAEIEIEAIEKANKQSKIAANRLIAKPKR